MMNGWHSSQFINHWYRVFESSAIGFGSISLLKRLKKSVGFQTHFKEAPEKVNHRLISPRRMTGILRRLGLGYHIMGYNVLLPLDLPVLGKRGNLCERSKLFSRGLKDNRVLKYFGAKLVIVIKK
jgi:hypothetical protein